MNQLNLKQIRNIYYMLCYAVEELNNMVIGDIDFDDVAGLNDLLALMLIKTLDIWRSQQPLRLYIQKNENMSKPRGRLNIVKSYTSGVYARGQLNCDYCQLNIDNKYNQVIKMAIKSLVDAGKKDIKPERLILLYSYLNELSSIKDISYSEYTGTNIDYMSLNYCYRPVIAASIIIIENTLARDQENENVRLFELDDNNRYCRIFESFICNYIQSEYRHTSTGLPVEALKKHVFFERDPNTGAISGREIPDLIVRTSKRAAIIDAKWHTNFDTATNAKYQLYAYANAYSIEYKDDNRVVSVAIFAKLTNNIPKNIRSSSQYDERAKKTLEYYPEFIDLSSDFKDICSSLTDLVDYYLVKLPELKF